MTLNKKSTAIWQRVICLVLCICVLSWSVFPPQPVKAVVGVDDAIIAAALLSYLASVGVAWVIQDTSTSTGLVDKFTSWMDSNNFSMTDDLISFDGFTCYLKNGAVSLFNDFLGDGIVDNIKTTTDDLTSLSYSGNIISPVKYGALDSSNRYPLTVRSDGVLVYASVHNLYVFGYYSSADKTKYILVLCGTASAGNFTTSWTNPVSSTTLADGRTLYYVKSSSQYVPSSYITCFDEDYFSTITAGLSFSPIDGAVGTVSVPSAVSDVISNTDQALAIDTGVSIPSTATTQADIAAAIADALVVPAAAAVDGAIDVPAVVPAAIPATDVPAVDTAGEGTGTGTGTDTSNYKVSLIDVFPFCIPFDIAAMLGKLDADPVAPKFTWDFYILGNHYYFVIDLSQFDSVAEILRNMEFLAFAIGLAFATRNLIRG